MLSKVENGLLEGFSSEENKMLNLFNDPSIVITEEGAILKENSFYETVFPISEFQLVIQMNFIPVEEIDYALVYLSNGDKKSGVKISNSAKIRISFTGSAFSADLWDIALGSWVSINSFSPSFNPTFLGFFSTREMTISYYKLFKSPFSKFFIDGDNVELFVDGILVNRSDMYDYYLWRTELELENRIIQIYRNGSLFLEQNISISPGDVYFLTSRGLKIVELSTDKENLLHSNYKTFQLFNYGSETQENVTLYSSYEPSIEVLFYSDEQPEPSPFLFFDSIPSQSYKTFSIQIRKLTSTTWKRYNFNIVIE